MATTKHKAYSSSIASVHTTSLNSLANVTNSAASSAIDNTSALDLYDDLTLTVATQGSARSAGATVNVYLIPALDGTNYDAVNETTAELVAVFPLDAAVTARQVTRRDIPIPPGLFEYFVRNQTGQAFASSGNILERRPHSLETA
jgi:hypothetical protein